ncbi:hypothetical protein DPEC_G00323910 [Dallia pectoralis]|uniref:Uncharacterized protein n=1 Tax=Dallia pectoralis TaxID=75939 RepID=A0ACC2FAV7_DALPE|nr:hypothetical protein DPEC_G00323910 [Dallia pectoralis]
MLLKHKRPGYTAGYKPLVRLKAPAHEKLIKVVSRIIPSRSLLAKGALRSVGAAMPYSWPAVNSPEEDECLGPGRASSSAGVSGIPVCYDE